MVNLGERIRELRLSRNLTLKQVAEDTGLSVSFLSMVERNQVSISVDNLEKLARYYQVHMVYFFAESDHNEVFIARHEELIRSKVNLGQSPAAVTLLTNQPNARMEPLLVHIGPGKEEPHFRQHQADVFVYVIQGSVRLVSETGEEHRLASGDLAYYVNLPRRRIINASTTEPVTLLLVTAPPTTTLEELQQARQGSWLMGNDSQRKTTP